MRVTYESVSSLRGRTLSRPLEPLKKDEEGLVEGEMGALLVVNGDMQASGAKDLCHHGFGFSPFDLCA